MAVPLVPTTVAEPAFVGVHVAAVHAPPSPRLKVVDAVTSPRELPQESNPWAVYVWGSPTVAEALYGVSAILVRAPGVTVTVLVALSPP